MQGDLVLALAIGIGFVAGLRALTAPAAVSWAACLGWLDLHGSPLGFMGSRVTVVILSLLAIAEYVADQLPSTPRRTAPGPLIGRILMGGLCGASLCAAADRSVLPGAILGGSGAVAGAFAGYHARRSLVQALKVKDRIIAVAEDIVAIVLAWLIVSPH